MTLISRKAWWIVGVVVACLGGAAGIIFLGPAAEHEQAGHVQADTAAITYACPMHMQIRSDKVGDCPICGMDLEPFRDAGSQMRLDSQQKANIGLQVEPLIRRRLARDIRTVGIFEPDEARQKVVSAWVDGRIERLYANFTGIEVTQGAHLFDLYSPTLYAVQNELTLARQALASMGAEHPSRTVQEAMVASARDKLLLLGFEQQQLASLEASGKPALVATVFSPMDGVVIEKHVIQGMYVERGQPLFRVADLSQLWLMVDVHERDLMLVELGQAVEIRADALAGHPRSGRVGFIDAVLNPATRTARVRVEVANPDRRLRPGMFATVAIMAELAGDGLPTRASVTGAFACPMHPLERSDDEQARCPICGMRLVASPARPERSSEPVLAVPRAAVLSTGLRHLVYIETRNAQDAHGHLLLDDHGKPVLLDTPEYVGVEVVLGPLASEWSVEDGARKRLGEYFPVLSGLEEGARIVVNGQFLIDSQMELTGKPSLLHSTGIGSPGSSPAKPDEHAGH